jgi:hypothetical protein
MVHAFPVQRGVDEPEHCLVAAIFLVLSHVPSNLLTRTCDTVIELSQPTNNDRRSPGRLGAHELSIMTACGCARMSSRQDCHLSPMVSCCGW